MADYTPYGHKDYVKMDIAMRWSMTNSALREAEGFYVRSNPIYQKKYWPARDLFSGLFYATRGYLIKTRKSGLDEAKLDKIEKNIQKGAPNKIKTLIEDYRDYTDALIASGIIEIGYIDKDITEKLRSKT
jgi:hypothetical protein